MNRRRLLAAAAAMLAAPALARAQSQHGMHHGPALRPATPSPDRFHNLFQGGAPHHLTPAQEAQRVYDSPAPAGPPGRWVARARYGRRRQRGCSCQAR